MERPNLTIDFLYLDLSICDRCQATERALDAVLAELRGALGGGAVTVNKIKITSDAQARTYDFQRSPTIRINGRDIEEILTGTQEIKDNYCASCAQGCGEACARVTGGGTQCRTVEYQGTTYEAVPRAMIHDAIVQVLGVAAPVSPPIPATATAAATVSATPSCCAHTAGAPCGCRGC